MAENADTVIEAVREGALLTMEPENNARLAAVEQAIIEMQERALALHKQKVGHKITEAEYNEAIQECGQQMQQLEAQQAELQTVATRYAEVKVWLDAFETNIRTGEIMSTNDAMVMKTLVERIIVNDTDIEVQFKCGVSVQQEYVK